jgi:hypothetical protein
VRAAFYAACWPWCDGRCVATPVERFSRLRPGLLTTRVDRGRHSIPASPLHGIFHACLPVNPTRRRYRSALRPVPHNNHATRRRYDPFIGFNDPIPKVGRPSERIADHRLAESSGHPAQNRPNRARYDGIRPRWTERPRTILRCIRNGGRAGRCRAKPPKRAMPNRQRFARNSMLFSISNRTRVSVIDTDPPLSGRPGASHSQMPFAATHLGSHQMPTK